LGLTARDAELLRQALLDAASGDQDNLRPTYADDYGQRYEDDCSGSPAPREGRSADLRAPVQAVCRGSLRVGVTIAA